MIMFVQPLDMKFEEEFSRPVESIMRCEDFKSNFARKLSNRYISRSPVATRQDNSLKLPPNPGSSNNASDKNEDSSQLSKNITEQCEKPIKPLDKKTNSSDFRETEVSALNMEVETLRWQLSQTEANRQMHIALLKQIVSFLSRVKEHIACQKPELGPRKETMSARLTPRSFHLSDLPRSRSVVHVNKNVEYTLGPAKKISTRKISKSISNVNGYRECSGSWSPSKLSLTSENETTQKLSEEMSRLITLANTVLNIKLPDLACACNDVDNSSLLTLEKLDEANQQIHSTSSLNNIAEDTTNAVFVNNICDSQDTLEAMKDKDETNNASIKDFILSPSPINSLKNCDDEKFEKEDTVKMSEPLVKINRMVDKVNQYDTANFIEDESGFSSMSSFQEIGIPIISIIPPSPCKEMGYMDDISDILDETTKWTHESIDLDKQAVKVFWV